jgi:glutamyl-tRNA synthetase
VRSRGGRLVWRVEDLDPPRTVPGAAEEQLAELAWLGLDWDEGPRADGSGESGPHGPYRQSQRGDVYRQALAKLHAAGRIFPCRLSRKDLPGLASAPHGHEGLPPYPPRLRPKRVEPGWFERLLAAPRPDAAIRFRVEDPPVRFVDRVQGEIVEDVQQVVGDFVLRRRDAQWAYQHAVVVDDLAMEITEIVRGSDLLASTGRQVQLTLALGGQPPDYAHVPLLLNHDGEKLSKRDGGATLSELRAAAVPPRQVVGWLAHSLGLLDRVRPIHPGELIEHFSWGRIPRQDAVLAGDPVAAVTQG